MAQIIDNAILDNLDEVDEAYHGMFSLRDGKYHFDGVAGIKTVADVERVQSALRKEREEHVTSRDSLSKFEGIDPDSIHAQLDRIKELELAAEGKLDEEGINKVVESRVATATGPLQRNLNKLQQERDSLAEQNETLQGAAIKRSIMDKVGDALKESKGFNPAATEDVMLRAERLFELNEDGSVTARDNVGITPGITPSEWLIEQQSKCPHWWGDSSGGGAKPPGGPGNSGENPWSRDSWNVTEQNKLYKTNPTRAQQLAKAAGSSIGGLKPPASK